MESKILCQGCLSVSRKLSPLDDTLDLYFTLLGDLNVKEERKCSEILLCWECIAFLRRIKTFQKRIIKAQLVLRKFYMEHSLPVSLSSLSVVQKDTFDLIIQCELSEIELMKPLGNWVLKEEKVEEFSDGVDIKEEEEKDDDNMDMCERDNDVQDDSKDKITKKKEMIQKKPVKHLKKFEAKTKKITKKKIIIQKETVKHLKQFEAKTKITSNNIDFRNMCKYFTIVTSPDEIDAVLERERNSVKYLKNPYRCGKCALSFDKAVHLRGHTRRFHSQKGEQKLHLLQVFKCNLCGELCRAKARGKYNHLKKNHAFTYTCRMCDARLGSKAQICEHYDKYHKIFICDYCGVKYKSKESIEAHIGRKHTKNECKICNKVFAKQRYLRDHNVAFHPTKHSHVKTELAYCVECDRQFESVYKYRRHLINSARHKPRKSLNVPCPKCGKVFARRIIMENHYKLFHIKQNDHYCSYCDKYYVNAYALKKHKLHVHDKYSLPKNKICSVCHRGFSANRILTNHMRTHTGERPFSCTECTAAFAQKTALNSHMKALHKIHVKKTPAFDD